MEVVVALMPVKSVTMTCECYLMTISHKIYRDLIRQVPHTQPYLSYTKFLLRPEEKTASATWVTFRRQRMLDGHAGPKQIPASHASSEDIGRSMR